MKLVSINVEGKKHQALVLPFLTEQAANVVCLQEAPEEWCVWLQQSGYHTTFAPMLLRKRGEEPIYTEGVIFASKLSHASTIEYYYGSANKISIHTHRGVKTVSHPVIVATVLDQDTSYTIATTHLMVTIDGNADEHQKAGFTQLMSLLSNHQPHTLCGDFNIPRRVNELYESLITRYSDEIPTHYTSSLDKNIHRLGNSTNLNAPIFDTYMVDYLLTQKPYQAFNTELRFGVSDHAAIIATLTKQPQ